MSHGTARISRSIKGFDLNIKTTSAHLIALFPPLTGPTNGARLGLTSEDMSFWANLRLRWDVLMPLYNNKKGTRTTEVIEGLKLIIKDAVAYDKLHNFYNRISVNPNAILADFEAFSIKRNTPLAASTHTRVAAPGMKVVIIALKKMGHLTHQLLVTAPDHKGRGMEDGVKEIIVTKAITEITELAPALSTFVNAGSVSRGLLKVNHADGTQGKKAWYVACVKNSRNELGNVCEPIGFLII